MEKRSENESEHALLLHHYYGVGKVIIEKSRGEVSLMEQDTIENVS